VSFFFFSTESMGGLLFPAKSAGESVARAAAAFLLRSKAGAMIEYEVGCWKRKQSYRLHSRVSNHLGSARLVVGKLLLITHAYPITWE
jgi:hypothetical protein